MNNKKIILWVVGVFIVFAIGVFIINYVVKEKVETRLSQLPETINLEYSDLQVNILTGNISIENPKFTVYGKTTKKLNAEVALKTLTITDFSSWNYLIQGNINIKTIAIDNPIVKYHHNDKIDKQNHSQFFNKNIKQEITLESLKVINGNLEVFNVSKDSLALKMKQLNFEINDISTEKTKDNSGISYQNLNLTTHSVFFAINEYENLSVEALTVNQNNSKLENILFKTKYSEEALSRIITSERDHYNLKIDTLIIENQDFGMYNDSLFYFKSDAINLQNPKLSMYRNKLIADDFAYTPLYSKMLRELNVNLEIDTISLNNGSISYTEKVNLDTKGGELLFSELHAKINNINTVSKAENTLTKVNIDAVFMKNTPIHVQWDFDIMDMNDGFIFKSEIGKLQADHLNQFMQPNLNVKLEGEFDTLFFTVSGNENVSHTDLKVDYKNFDVIVLKDNGREKNKLLSAVLNIFISKDSDDENGAFRYGSAEAVEREKNKSIFSFVWLSVRGALLNAITGNGEKAK